MKILVLEFKKFILSYVQLAVCAATAALLGLAVLYAAGRLLESGPGFAGFTVGVVDYDRSLETKLLMDFFNQEAVALVEMGETEAAAALETGEIPAYIVIPEDFAKDIRRGRNTPFALYGNPSFPLQWRMTQLIAQGGVAFLSASQAGIYAAMDYAYENGMGWDEIDAKLLLPVNASFIKYFLDSSGFYETVSLELLGGVSVTDFYGTVFIVFFAIISSMCFVKPLAADRGVMARSKSAGISFFRHYAPLLAIIWIGLSLFISPLFFISGIRAALISALLTGVLWFVSSLLPEALQCGFALFIIALLSALLCGGIVPLPYMPAVFDKLQYLSPAYWALPNVDRAPAPAPLVCTAALLLAGGLVRGRKWLR